ncbi:MAG TPA: hypothetical protein VME67_17230 [Mycobacterium sp.]|nr:hypothetical protein [Mycobacterium sp.]HTX96447.1 hypothetical protein [Mycobacterium sp.]
MQVPQDRVPVRQPLESSPVEHEVVAQQQVDDRADLTDHVLPGLTGQAHDHVTVISPVLDADRRPVAGIGDRVVVDDERDRAGGQVPARRSKDVRVEGRSGRP